MAQALNAFLSTATAQDVVNSRPGRAIVAAKPDETVAVVLKRLTDNNVLSAPVLDGDKCLGLIDLGDIVSFLMHAVYKKLDVQGEKGAETVSAMEHKALPKSELDTTQGLGFRFFHAHVRELINYSKQNAYHPVPATAPLGELVKLLSSGLRRVPITDANGHIVSLISQSAVLQYITSHMEKLGDIVNQPLTALGIGPKRVISINNRARALDAFVLLHEYQITGVAMLNDQHNLVGNISLKDIKGLADDFKRLILPVDDYIKIIRAEAVHAVFPAITCHESDHYGKVLAKVKATNIHRLYIESGDGKTLIGVASLRDLLAVVASRQGQ